MGDMTIGQIIGLLLGILVVVVVVVGVGIYFKDNILEFFRGIGGNETIKLVFSLIK